MKPASLLTRRESEVAQAFSAGATYKEIARDLKVSPATIRTHLQRIYEKLEVSSKIELARALAEPETPEYAQPRVDPSVVKSTIPKLIVRDFSAVNSDVMTEAFLAELLVNVTQRFASSSWLSVHHEGDPKTAAFVLDGSVTSLDGSLKINALLLDNRDRRMVWSGQDTGHLNDVPAIAEALADRVAEVLTGLWPGAPINGKRVYPTEPPDRSGAYDYYRSGIEHLYQLTPRSYVYAAGAMRQALQIDPRFVPALSGLSIALSIQAFAATSFEQLEAIEAERIEAIEKARAISPDDAPVLVETAWMCARVGDMSEASSYLIRAVESAPNSPDLLSYAALRGAFWCNGSHLPIEWITRALETADIRLPWYNFAYGFSHLAAGNAAEAIPVLSRTRDPITEKLYGATALLELGQTEDARLVFAGLLEVAPYFDLDLHLKAMAAKESRLGHALTSTYDVLSRE